MPDDARAEQGGGTSRRNLGMEKQIRAPVDEYAFSIDVAEQVRRMIGDVKIPCEVNVEIEVNEIE